MFVMRKCFVIILSAMSLCSCANKPPEVVKTQPEGVKLLTVAATVSDRYKEPGGAGTYTNEYQHLLAPRPVPGGSYVTLEPKARGNEKTFVEMKMPPPKVTVTEVVSREITVFFKSNSSILGSEAAELLRQVSQSSPDVVKVSVAGYTDARGKSPANDVLSKERSDSVVSMLVSSGIAAKSIEAEGFGSSSPIDANDSVTGRARNRRVEIKIVGAEKNIKPTSLDVQKSTSKGTGK
jgi:outer membrane protein OmpA-like peptidoglycan-associated protein